MIILPILIMKKSQIVVEKAKNVFRENFVFPSIVMFNEIRYLFSSEEWIKSYLKFFPPYKDLFIFSKKGVYGQKNALFGLMPESFNQFKLITIGSPYNDYNSLLSALFYLNKEEEKERHAEDFLCELNQLLLSGYFLEVDCLFSQKEISFLRKVLNRGNFKFKLVKSAMPVVSCFLTRGEDKGEVEEILRGKFSKKFLKYFRKTSRNRTLQLNRIEGREEFFDIALNNLLSYRKLNFFKNFKKDVVGAFSSQFEEFIRELISFPSVKEKSVIFELLINGKYAASDLFFYTNNTYLCYLRAFNKYFAKFSPGIVLSYLVHRDLLLKFRKVIIDYTRGDEAYKFRIGGRLRKVYKLTSINEND
jgi:hypothetical protein